MQSWARAAHLYWSAQVNSALHPYGIAKSSTIFGWGKGENITSVGWQVTPPCILIWHANSRSIVVWQCYITNCYTRVIYTGEPRRNRWTDGDAVCGTDFRAPTKPRIGRGSHWRHLANTVEGCGLVSNNYFDRLSIRVFNKIAGWI